MSQTTQNRRLVRRTDDKVVAGVASGLAAYLGVDPVLVRVGFVLAATIGGFGILAYIAMWVLTPEGEAGQVPIEARRDAGFWVAIGLFVLAALAIADNVADRNLLWPIVLIAAGVALWRRSDSSSDSTSEPSSFPTPPEPSSAPSEYVMPTPTAPTEPVAPVAPDWTPPPPPDRASTPSEPSPPKAPHESSRLGGMTIAVALLVSGIGWTLDLAGLISYPAATAFAVALGILAIGLVIGTWLGRARWLVFPAMVMTPIVIALGVTDSLDLRLGSGFGERTYAPVTAADVQDDYRLGVGQLVVDLTDLDLTAADTVTTRVALGAGEAQILVPSDVDVTVNYAVSAGEVRLFEGDAEERRDSGTGLEGTLTSDAGSEGAGRLIIEADVTFGELNVERR